MYWILLFAERSMEYGLGGSNLKVVLVHRHGDGDAEAEDSRDAVARQLDVQDEVGGLCHLEEPFWSFFTKMGLYMPYL